MVDFGTALAVCVIAAGLLAGCDRQHPVTINVAGNVHSHLSDFIPAFKERYPHIDVNIVDMRYPPGSKLVNSNRTHDAYVGYLSTANSGIDIYEIDLIWLSEFVENGWVKPLEKLFSPQAQQHFLSGVVEGTRIDDRIWAVQEWVDFGLMYYRRDVLESLGLNPPKTWEELLALGDAARERNMALLSFQGDNYEGLTCFFNELLHGHGGDWIDADGKLTLTSPPAEMALRFLKDMKSKGYLPPNITQYNEELAHKDFLGGRSLFSRNWPYVYRLAAHREWAMQDNIGVIPIPHGVNHTDHHGTTGGWMLVISEYSRHVADSWKFIEFITSEKAQRHLFAKYGLVPTRKNLFQEVMPKVLPGIGNELSDQAYLTPRPLDQNYREISRIISQKVWETVAYYDVKGVREQLKSGQTEIDSILFRKSRRLRKEWKELRPSG